MPIDQGKNNFRNSAKQERNGKEKRQSNERTRGRTENNNAYNNEKQPDQKWDVPMFDCIFDEF